MKAISNIRAVMAILIFFFSLSFVSCTEETLDYNNPDVDLFVKQLKAGKYSVESPEGLNTIPRFTVEVCRRFNGNPFFPVGSGFLFRRWQASFRRVYFVDSRNNPPGAECFDGVQNGTCGCREL